jgi:hypothetical protein
MAAGPSMKPIEFRDILNKLFHIYYPPKQLGAMVQYLDKRGDKMVDHQDFLAYFFVLVREEQAKKFKRNVSSKLKMKVSILDLLMIYLIVLAMRAIMNRKITCCSLHSGS